MRRARMQGKNACWVPGTDHASIATEAKVVHRLREQGIKKSDLSRDAFLEHAWDWTREHGGIILKQLRKLGASCDWERTNFTLDPHYSKSVIDTFLDLHAKGHLLKGKIAFFNEPMDPGLIRTGSAYGRAGWQRWGGASMAAKYGAVKNISNDLARCRFGHCTRSYRACGAIDALRWMHEQNRAWLGRGGRHRRSASQFIFSAGKCYPFTRHRPKRSGASAR